jgi:uncharacterized membrane protein YukC
MSTKDFMKRQPTKNEKVFSEITMYLHDIDHRIWSVASQVLAIGMIQDIDPKKMAELLTGSEEKLQEYAKKVNEEIKAIEAAKNPEGPKEESNVTVEEASSHDHEHEHNHDEE